MHMLGTYDDENNIEQWVELKLNSVLYSHFSTMTEFREMVWASHRMESFSNEIKTLLYDTVRGSRNATSEVQPYLPFWPNPEKGCVEYASRQTLHGDGTISCQPKCFHVKWEEAIYQAFLSNGKFV